MKNKKFYLTKQGLEKVEQDLKKLKSLRRAKVGGEAPIAVYSSELNAEFVDFREDLNYLDAKIDELEHVLKNYEIIKAPATQDKSKISLGASVLVDIDGQQDEFLIVGTLEANPSLGRISDESPVGQVLLNRKAGDEIVLNSPIKVVYKIKKVSYNG